MLLVPLNQVFDPMDHRSMDEQCLCSFNMEKCGLLVGWRKHQRLRSRQERHKRSSSRVPRAGVLGAVHRHAVVHTRGAERGHGCTSPGAQGALSVGTGLRRVVHRAESRDAACGG